MSKYNINSPSSFWNVMKSIEDKLTTTVEQVDGDVTKAVADCAISCLEKAIPRTPIESGFLRSTGKAYVNGNKVAQGDGKDGIIVFGAYQLVEDKVEGEVAYGPCEYAIRQHEDLSLRHDRTDGYKRRDGTTVNRVAGGQAKYLESVVVENIDSWKQSIIEAARRGLSE